LLKKTSKLITSRKSSNKFKPRSKTKQRRSLLRSKRLPKPMMLTSSSAFRRTNKSKDAVAVVAIVVTEVTVPVATDVVAVVVNVVANSSPANPVLTVPRPPRMANAVVEIAVAVAVVIDPKLPSP